MRASAASVTGDGKLKAIASDVEDTATVVVTQRASKMTSSHPTLAQGGTTTLTVTVADGVGTPLYNQPVSFLPASGLTIAPLSARTAQNGSVTVTLKASATATSGLRRVTVSVDRPGIEALIAFADVTVTATAATAVVSPAVLAATAGASLQVALTAIDTNGAPASGAWVDTNASVCDTGVKVGAGVSTGSDGIATILFQVGPTTVAGTYHCELKVSGVAAVVVSVVVS